MLLETVPNVSEGRRDDVLGRLADAVSSVGGADLLDLSADADHNRSVLTLVGEPRALENALLALYAAALEAIDLRRHEGVHPRIGAVDVAPFVPLAGATRADAVAAARSLARRVAERFGLAVYLYGWAAPAAERARLSDLRRGGLEGLATRIAEPAWAPDFGPARLDPRAGATAVGARFFLVAFNAELASADLGVARAVARAVRESSGGLPAVQALGLPLAGRGRAQVSMNLTDFRLTSVPRALAAVEAEARARGTEVVATEIVGLAPAAALEGAGFDELKVRDGGPHQLLDTHLRRLGLPGLDDG